VRAAELALHAGAAGITVHLREDRRHIQDDDVARLRAMKRGILNLEMALTDEMVGIAIEVRPDRVHAGPREAGRAHDRGRPLAPPGGRLPRDEAAPRAADRRRLPVSLFLDPDESIADLASDTGATFVEIHTGHYANARGADVIDRELQRILHAAERFAAVGLRVHAGHGLDTGNVTALLHRFPFQELSIGHSIVSRSIELGMAAAVREMIDAIRSA
jgi:pyridoxine 5-phosphate synthase